MMKEPVYDMIIAGGGASGMMAALAAVRAGKTVLLLEQKEEPGKKIHATGNGRCNFTNEKMDMTCYYGDIELFDAVYPQFTKEDTLAFFHDLGIYPRNKRGYYYPAGEQAASVVSAFSGALLRYSAVIACGEKITGLFPSKECWNVVTEKGRHRGRTLLICCGLKAAPKLGSDGSLLALLEKLGHHLVPVLPALCGFYAKGMRFPKVSGVRTEASVRLMVDDQFMASDTGELQLTDYGISGIPVFQISSPASRALYEGRKVQVITDFLPLLKEEEVFFETSLRKAQYPDQPASFLLNGLIPAKLAEVLLAEAGINSRDCCRDIYDSKLGKLSHVIKNFVLTLTRVRDFEFAQVCSGGIPASEINIKTLESRLHPGLFFAGEVLNIDGICGGYNLQWAWSSGYAAAKAACERE